MLKFCLNFVWHDFVSVFFKLNKWCNYLLVISLFHRLYTFSICFLNYSSFSITHHSNFLFLRIYCVALSIALSTEIYVIFATCAAKNHFRSWKVDFIVRAFVFFKLILSSCPAQSCSARYLLCSCFVSSWNSLLISLWCHLDSLETSAWSMIFYVFKF